MPRILVISDSHGFRGKLDQVLMKAESTGSLDAVIHLGDGYMDMKPYEDAFPLVYAMPGNCDGDRGTAVYPELFGVRIYLTHGHQLHVKSGVHELLSAALATDCQAALFGHTHKPFCEEREGVLLLNPGSVMNGQFAILTVHEKSTLQAELY